MINLYYYYLKPVWPHIGFFSWNSQLFCSVGYVYFFWSLQLICEHTIAHTHLRQIMTILIQNEPGDFIAAVDTITSSVEHPYSSRQFPLLPSLLTLRLRETRLNFLPQQSMLPSANIATEFV